MIDYQPEHAHNGHRSSHAYEEDDDEDHHGARGVQCAQQ